MHFSAILDPKRCSVGGGQGSTQMSNQHKIQCPAPQAPVRHAAGTQEGEGWGYKQRTCTKARPKEPLSAAPPPPPQTMGGGASPPPPHNNNNVFFRRPRFPSSWPMTHATDTSTAFLTTSLTLQRASAKRRWTGGRDHRFVLLGRKSAPVARACPPADRPVPRIPLQRLAISGMRTGACAREPPVGGLGGVWHVAFGVMPLPAPIGRSPFAALPLDPFPPPAAVPMGLSPPCAPHLPPWPILPSLLPFPFPRPFPL